MTMETITFFHPPYLRKWKIFLSTVMISFQSIIMWIQNKRGRVNVAIPPSSSLSIPYVVFCYANSDIIFPKIIASRTITPFFQKKTLNTLQDLFFYLKESSYPSLSFSFSSSKSSGCKCTNPFLCLQANFVALIKRFKSATAFSLSGVGLATFTAKSFVLSIS